MEIFIHRFSHLYYVIVLAQIQIHSVIPVLKSTVLESASPKRFFVIEKKTEIGRNL
jgi:hypothetical protein